MFLKIKLLLLLILLTSCNNYKATDPLDFNEYKKNTSPIPENVDPKYFIKSDYKEDQIESVMLEYFKENKYYIIFLKDTKENIDKNNIIDTINTVINKNEYIKGVSLDLSRTDITELKDNAFKNNKNLAHIKLPNTIKTIGAEAFSGCLILKTVNFPSSITEIKNGAFKICKSLYHINLSETKITIINQQTFYDCSSLISAVLPETISSGIDGNAFAYCTSLNTINIPSKLNVIGDAAFYECRSLKNIKLNENITQIYRMAFYNCSSLKKINLPKKLTSIGEETFIGCSLLQNIEYNGDKANNITQKSIFDTVLKPKNLYLPNVKSDDGTWNNFLNYDWKNNGNIIFGKSMP